MPVYTPGRYNINFNICAIILNLIVIFVFINKKKVRDRRSVFFIAIESLLTVSSIMEIVDALFLNGTIIMPKWAAVFFLSMDLYLHNLISLVFLLYILEVLGRFMVMSNVTRIIYAIPEICLAALFFIPDTRSKIFSIDDNLNYHKGFGGVILYIVVLVYFCMGVISLIKSRRVIVGGNLWYLIYTVVGLIFCNIPYFIIPTLRITIFLQSALMLGVFANIEDNSRLFDAETGLLTRYSMWSESRVLFESGYESYIISVNVRNADSYEITLGTEILSGIGKEIGKWMHSLASSTVHVYHNGYGVYVILLFGGSKDDAVNLSEKVIARFQDSWNYMDTPVTFGIQLIMGKIPGTITNKSELLSFVDRKYDPNLPSGKIIMADETMKQLSRRDDVRAALGRTILNDSFQVYYQPIYDNVKDRITSCEALIRMNDDKLGFVSPEEFIKVAEQTGLISQIGEIVFKKVCAFISENDPMQYGLDYIEVNLSTIQCMDPDLYDSFIRIMKKYHVPTSAINFEITESAMIQNETAMEDVTGKFRQDGFNFSLDDFGTGNSNFSYLIRYPFKLIKIDKSFLWNSEKNHKNAIVLKNMLELIKDLGKDTVVEGVETAAQRDMLRADGVRYLQGYFYSKPVPPDDFLKYLKDFNSESSIEKHHA